MDVAVKSLLESGVYKWITPSPNAVKLAFKLRSIGYKDIIDNLFYATSIAENMILLTMDNDLKNFLVKHGFNVENLLNHEELLEKL